MFYHILENTTLVSFSFEATVWKLFYTSCVHVIPGIFHSLCRSTRLCGLHTLEYPAVFIVVQESLFVFSCLKTLWWWYTPDSLLAVARHHPRSGFSEGHLVWNLAKRDRAGNLTSFFGLCTYAQVHIHTYMCNPPPSIVSFV